MILYSKYWVYSLPQAAFGHTCGIRWRYIHKLLIQSRADLLTKVLLPVTIIDPCYDCFLINCNKTHKNYSKFRIPQSNTLILHQLSATSACYWIQVGKNSIHHHKAKMQQHQHSYCNLQLCPHYVWADNFGI